MKSEVDTLKKINQDYAHEQEMLKNILDSMRIHLGKSPSSSFSSFVTNTYTNQTKDTSKSFSYSLKEAISELKDKLESFHECLKTKDEELNKCKHDIDKINTLLDLVDEEQPKTMIEKIKMLIKM